MEQKLDMLLEMVAGLSEKMTHMQGDINDLKKMKPTFEATQKQVAEIKAVGAM